MTLPPLQAPPSVHSTLPVSVADWLCRYSRRPSPWPITEPLATSTYGPFVLWTLRPLATSSSGHCNLWPLRALATSTSGLFVLWPLWIHPVWASWPLLANSTSGQYELEDLMNSWTLWTLAQTSSGHYESVAWMNVPLPGNQSYEMILWAWNRPKQNDHKTPINKHEVGWRLIWAALVIVRLHPGPVYIQFLAAAALWVVCELFCVFVSCTIFHERWRILSRVKSVDGTVYANQVV